MAEERKVPVLKSEGSLIDDEFDSIREKFEAEMGKMEAEMARFRAQLIASTKSAEQPTEANSESSFRRSLESAAGAETETEAQSVSSSRRSTTTRSRTVRSSARAALEEGHRMIQQEVESGNIQRGNLTRAPTATSEHCQRWLSELNSPLIKEDAGGRMLKLRFDVSLYEPEQILVKTLDRRLQVQARREERSQNSSLFREYNREFLLPEGVDVNLIRSSLSADGVLTVEAPLPLPAGELLKN